MEGLEPKIIWREDLAFIKGRIYEGEGILGNEEVS